MNNSFWKNRRVLLTGHTGFKGSWLALWLQELESDLLGYALPPPSEVNLYELARVGSGMRSIYGDIRNLQQFQDVMNSFQPEIVFHLAAQPLVRRSYAHPVETYTTNVIGTVNLLEAVRLCDSVKVVVNVTTDKCYRNNEWHWGYRENEPMGGKDPYSSSKGCSELVTAAYRTSFFSDPAEGKTDIRVATARAGNCIGGGDWGEDRLIPDMIRAFIEKRPTVIRNPLAIRPWQYVLDPLHGYLILAEKLWRDGQAFADGWNFGPGNSEGQNVAWIADRLVTLWEHGVRWELDPSRSAHEERFLKLDSSKARDLLGWEPRHDLATSLQCIVDWYYDYLAGEDMREVTRMQIQNFIALLSDSGSLPTRVVPVKASGPMGDNCYA